MDNTKSYNGQFLIPHSTITPYVPISSQQSYFEFHDVHKTDTKSFYKPLAIILPGTGEVGYERRRELVSIPLSKYNISSIILEGPYYGMRSLLDKSNSNLKYVSDLLVLGFETIVEVHCYAIFRQLV